MSADFEAIHAFARPDVPDLDSEVGFDVRAYARNPQELRRTDIDLTQFSTRPLAPATVRAITHLAGAERHTIRLLRDVLVTPSHREARVTAFLTTWAYEQYWIGDTLEAILEANGTVRARRPGILPTVRKAIGDRTLPMYNALTTNLIGDDFVASHMVRGLLDTLVCRLAYHRLAALDSRPELVQLVARIRSVKAPHVAFYELQAHERLAHSPRSRRLTRLALNLLWSWPGSRYEDRATTSAVVRHLLGDPSCRALVAEVDDRIADLPGLTGVDPLRGAVARYGLGRGVPSHTVPISPAQFAGPTTAKTRR
ncbi:MAG: hypothetical protein ACRDVZ_00530 [Jiangellaceae bacterium]